MEKKDWDTVNLDQKESDPKLDKRECCSML